LFHPFCVPSTKTRLTLHRREKEIQTGDIHAVGPTKNHAKLSSHNKTGGPTHGSISPVAWPCIRNRTRVQAFSGFFFVAFLAGSAGGRPNHGVEPIDIRDSMAPKWFGARRLWTASTPDWVWALRAPLKNPLCVGLLIPHYFRPKVSVPVRIMETARSIRRRLSGDPRRTPPATNNHCNEAPKGVASPSLT